MKRILSIRVVRETDYAPDLSYLGRYTDNWQDGAIERNKPGEEQTAGLLDILVALGFTPEEITNAPRK